MKANPGVKNPTSCSGMDNACKTLSRHFFGLHFRIMKKDVVKADDGKQYYSCKFCDYRSNCKYEVPHSSYNARIKLAGHTMSLHIEEVKGKL
jgi:hypothetical protein